MGVYEREPSNKCFSWRFTLVVLGVIQIVLIVGFFSNSKSWSVLPIHFVSKKINDINAQLHHHLGIDSWIHEDSQTHFAEVSHYPIINAKVKNNYSVLDIHSENDKYGHTWEDVDAHDSDTGTPKIIPNSVAIGLGITSHRNKWESVSQIKSTFPFFKSLLPSFCETASNSYSYNFFLAYDTDDPFYTKIDNLFNFQDIFSKYIIEKCPKGANYSIHFVQCSHRKQPARAQNDAMMAAYMYNVEFYYRVNDDTKMKTAGWTEAFIKTLKEFDPPYVGVVGPLHRGGNTAILTYDFVHYSHIHIHGFYYPRMLTDWFADRWITDVYRPKRCVKVKSMRLDHTLEAGQRYSQHYKVAKTNLRTLIQHGKDAIDRFIKFLKSDQKQETPEKVKVLSYSLSGKNPQYTYGAVRNAQLWPMFFPGWKFRVYLIDPSVILKSNSSKELLVPKQVVDKLKLLGAELIFLDEKFLSIPPLLWKYVVTDDEKVDYFLVQNTDKRLSDKESLLSTKWIMENTTSFICFRDRREHAFKAVVNGLFGANASEFRKVLGTYMTSYLLSFTIGYKYNSTNNVTSNHQPTQEEIELKFLETVIWPKVKLKIKCYDSVSDKIWPNSTPMPHEVNGIKLTNSTKLGTIYNEFDEELSVK